MRTVKITAISILFFTLSGIALFALEIGSEFTIGNIAFRRNRESTATGFEGAYYPWGISAYLNHDLSEDFRLHAGFFMDPILRNTIYTKFTYRHKFITLGVGPFFGVLNSPTSILKSGITTNIKLEAPGIIFVDFRTDSSIGGNIVQEGDYIQERSDISLGFYIPNAICSVNLFTKKYTEKTETGETVDNLSEYSFAVDIYQKNAPLKILLTLGFQDLSKTYIVADAASTHSLGTLFADVRGDIYLTDYLTLMAQFRGGVYTFGLNELTGLSNPGGFLFNVAAGFSLDIDAVVEKTKQPRAE